MRHAPQGSPPRGATTAKLDYIAARGGRHNSRRFARDQGLKADRTKQVSLGDLRFNQRRAHSQQWLPGKHHRAFGHREEVAGKAEASQIIPKADGCAPELRQRLEVGDLTIGEPQPGEILNGLLKASHH